MESPQQFSDVLTAVEARCGQQIEPVLELDPVVIEDVTPHVQHLIHPRGKLLLDDLVNGGRDHSKRFGLRFAVVAEVVQGQRAILRQRAEIAQAGEGEVSGVDFALITAATIGDR